MLLERELHHDASAWMVPATEPPEKMVLHRLSSDQIFNSGSAHAVASTRQASGVAVHVRVGGCQLARGISATLVRLRMVGGRVLLLSTQVECAPCV